MAGGSGIRAVAEEYKPCAAMVAVQCVYAAQALWVKAVFQRGMNPMVVVVYRQAVATVVLAPVAIMTNRKRLREMRLGMTGFLFVFVAALFGGTANMNMCYQGLQLGSPSLATTMMNLTPAITFLMAAAVGQETVNVREKSSIAKILGTAICVGAAITMAFFKGPKLMNQLLGGPSKHLHSLSTRWVVGALFLAGGNFCWSLWFILQAQICKFFPDPLSLSAWTCFLSTLQSALLSFFLLPDKSAWKIQSIFELSCFIFIGAFGTGMNLWLQSWCVSVRGPLYPAIFTPLNAVITTAFSTIVLHDELHIGSLLGTTGIVSGLYIVLWGKANEEGVPTQSKDYLTENVVKHLEPPDIQNTLATPLLVDSAGSAQQPK